MKAWKIALLALPLMVSGCSDDDPVASPDPGPDPDPSPVETVSADEATSMVLSIGSLSGVDGSVNFSLATEDGLGITELSSISLQYLGYPAEDWQASRSDSNFLLGWHQSLPMDCAAAPCDGVLDEVNPGQYRFTPKSFNWHDDVERHKVSFTVAGALAQAEQPLTAMASE